MIRQSLVLFLLTVGMPVLAETVTVSASVGVDSTEVVLAFDARPEFEARWRENGYSLRFSNASPLHFDLSSAIHETDGKRVADIRAVGNNQFEIDLACQCHARFSKVGDKLLVVAIHDGDETSPRAQTSVPILTSGVRDGEIAGSLPRATEPWMPPDEVPRLLPATPAQRSSSRGTDLLTYAEETAPHSVAVELIGRALAKAAAEGSVEAATTPSASGDAALKGGLAALDGQSNLSVQTPFDRVFGRGSWNVPPTPSGVACLPDSMVDVAGWGDSFGPADLGQMRGRIIAESGAVATDKVAELARFYIFLGFGREAQAAAAFMPGSPERDLVEALGDILDEGQSEATFLSAQVHCDGAVALWALLAKPVDAQSALQSDQALLLAFSALPPHLRTHLGPLLSERLHEAGLDDAARVAINAVTRTGARTDESELATARLELDGTHAPMARDTLKRISDGTDITAASALLELLRDAEDRGMAPNPAWVDDAPTLVAALEGTEVAEELNLAGLRGLIALGEFDRFRTAVVADEPGLNDQTRRNLSQSALKAATASADDAAFLQTEIGLSALLSPAEVTRGTRVEVARRLLSLGLAERAVRYVDAAPESRDERRVTADILTKSGRIEEAVALLSSESGPDEFRLLAAAHAAIGRHDQALEALVAAGADDDAVTAALRIADWSWVATHAEAEIAGAAQGLAEARSANVEDDEFPNGALIDAVRSRRNQALTLLEATQPTGTGTAFTN